MQKPALDKPARRPFGPVRKVRSVDEVAKQLREAMIDGHFQPGDRLPSERELSEEFAVSRATVREALRSLEATGIVDIRLGAAGGSFAVRPDPRLMGRALATMLLFEAGTSDDLHEFRVGFEKENALLATQRLTAEHREALVSILERAQAAPRGTAGWKQLEDVDFELHQLLAECTANSVRIAVAHGIHDAVRRRFDRTEPQANSPARLRREVTEIVSAVLDGDAQLAAERMGGHIQAWK